MKKHLTLALAMLALICTSAHAQLPSYLPTDGLVGWWPFNGNANDESGNGNDGVVNGATLTEDRFGNAGKAYGFDGADDFIEVSNSATLNPTSITISTWVEVNNSTGSQEYETLVAKWWQNLNCGGNSDCYLLLFVNEGDFIRAFTSQSTSAPEAVSSELSSVPIEQWIHLAFTYDELGFQKLYLNNNLIGTNNEIGAICPSTNNLLFGADSYLGQYLWRFLQGSLDDIAIYNRALTEQEIQNLYTGTTPAACLDLPANLQDGLVGYWPFCGNANDESGNGNNGTVNGATLVEDRFGNMGSAYSFDGVDDFISINSTVSVALERSVCFWARVNVGGMNVNPSSNIVSLGSDFNVTFGDWGEYNRGSLSVHGNVWVADSSVVDDGEWHLYSIVVNQNGGQNLQFFQDGNLLNGPNVQGLLNFATSTQPILFGNGYAEGTTFTGLLDDITIYNRALSPEEVTQLYAVQSTGDPTAGGSLVTTGPLANVPRGISY